MEPKQIIKEAVDNWSSKPAFTKIYGDEEAIISIFTLAHFIFGAIFAWLQIPLWVLIIFHIFYEIIENSNFMIRFFQSISDMASREFGIKPWTYYNGDSIANSVVDIFASILGWVTLTELQKAFI